MAHKARGSRRSHGGHDDEGHADERWLVTYADMLTLLLVLFIVLYAMSVVDPTKYVQLRAGLAAVFDPGSNAVLSEGGGVTSTDTTGSDSSEDVAPELNKKDTAGATSTSILDDKATAAVQTYQRAQAQNQAGRVQGEVDKFKKVVEAVQNALKAHGLEGAANFSIDERGLVITVVTNSVVFGGNSAELLRGGQQIIDEIAPALLKLPNRIEIDGHTNQQKVSTGPYPSGWELSSARASSVVRYLIDHYNYPASRLSAVGYSDQKPLYPASDPRSITRNRRVDLVILSNLASSDKALLPILANLTKSAR